MSRLDIIKARIKDLEKEANDLGRWGDDEFKNGTVLRWKYQFNEYGKWYTYVALKVNGKWYLTNRSDRFGMSWDDLVEFLAEAHKVKGLRIATSWEGLPTHG